MFDLPEGEATDVELLCGRFGPPAELPLAIDVGEASAIRVVVSGELRDIQIVSCDGGPVTEVAPGEPVAVEAGRHRMLLRGRAPGERLTVSWRAEPSTP